MQFTCNPVEALAQLLPNSSIVLMRQEQDSGVSQVLHSVTQQLVEIAVAGKNSSEG